jgi:hypothetical protein
MNQFVVPACGAVVVGSLLLLILNYLMNSELISSLLDALDKLSGGVHPGFRPVHAKRNHVLRLVSTFS